LQLQSAAGVAAIGRCTHTPRGIHATHRPTSAQLAGGTPTICSSHSQRSPSIRCELAIGWGFHYAVGIAYAALYLAKSRLVLASEPTLISALVFAIALVVPCFVMQPALGLGFFAARTPRPSVTRIISISGHAASVSISVPSRPVSFEPMRTSPPDVCFTPESRHRPSILGYLPVPLA